MLRRPRSLHGALPGDSLVANEWARDEWARDEWASGRGANLAKARCSPARLAFPPPAGRLHRPGRLFSPSIDPSRQPQAPSQPTRPIDEKTPHNTEVLRGFHRVVRAGLETATPTFSVQCSANKNAVNCGDFALVAELLPQRLPLAANLPDLADALRALVDPNQRRRLAVELLRE